MANRDTQMTLNDAVADVLLTLTGLDLEYDPSLDRYQAITRTLNRALRFIALEHEWGYYASTEEVGTVSAGLENVELNSKLRPRIINDDAVRLVDDDGNPRVWAYFLPRESLHKYAGRRGLWVSTTRTALTFSRPLTDGEAGLRIHVPVMREPVMFRLPDLGQDVPKSIQNQLIDFDYPDLVIAKACEMYAESDPVMQPRVQTLEARYKDMMYQLTERDERATDSPYTNEFVLPIVSDLRGGYGLSGHAHPHADERYL